MPKPPAKPPAKSKGGKVLSFKPAPAVASPVLFQLQTHERIREVRRMLTDRATLEEVAEFVQTDIGLFTGMALDSIMRYLAQYRDTIPKWEFRDELEVMEATEVSKALATTARARVNVIAELEDLWDIQRQRILTMRTGEETSQQINPFLGKEVERGQNLLKTLAVVYGDVNLHNAAAGEEADATHAAAAETTYGSPEVAVVAQSPESRRKVLQFAEKLLALGGRA